MIEKMTEIVRTMDPPLGGDDKVQMSYEVRDDKGVDRSDEQLWTQGDLYDAIDYLSDGADTLDDAVRSEDWALVEETRERIKKARAALMTMQSVAVYEIDVDLEMIGRTYADGYEYMLVRR